MYDRFLFRAWDKRLKYMFEVGAIRWVNGKISEVVRAGTGEIYDRDDIENLVLMQSTGLHAAKSYRGESEADRRIFEGDIVKVVWDSDPEYDLSDDENSEIYEINDIRYIPKISGSNIKYCEIISAVHDRTEGER